MLKKSVLLAAVASASAFSAATVLGGRGGLPAVSSARPLALRGGSAVKMVLTSPPPRCAFSNERGSLLQTRLADRPHLAPSFAHLLFTQGTANARCA